MRIMDEKLAQYDELLLELRNGQQTLTATQHGIQGTLELLLKCINAMGRGQSRGDGILPLQVQDGRPARPNQMHVPTPKWELPSFEGSNPKVWVRKCQRYFNLYRIDDAQKVEGAALYLNGDAEIWYNSLVLSRGPVTWDELRDEICDRFGDVLMEDVVEEFNKLNQTGGVEEFFRKFEDLMAQMIMRTQH